MGDILWAIGMLWLMLWAVTGRPVGLRAAAEAIVPSRRRLRAAQRAAQGRREQLQRYAYPAGWARAVPHDVAAAIAGWQGADGEAARRFLCHHWRLTYDLDGLVDIRQMVCSDCGSMEARTHDSRCPRATCGLCREKGGRHAGWCRPDGNGGRIAQGVYRDGLYRSSIDYDVRHYGGGRTRAVLRKPPKASWVDIGAGRDPVPLRDVEYDLIKEPCGCRTCKDRRATTILDYEDHDGRSRY